MRFISVFFSIMFLVYPLCHAQDNQESEDHVVEPIEYSEQQGKLLIKAARKGDLDGIRSALNKNAFVDYQDQDSGMAAIHYCAINGDNNAIRTLLGWGGDINLYADNGYTPLHFAVENGYVETVRLLTGWGAFVDTPEEFLGRTPLYMASARGDLEIMRNLIYYKADVNVKAYFRSYSPLHIALENEHYEAAEYLLQKGSYLNPWSVRQLTPLHWAAMDGKLQTLEWLISKGASLDAVSTEGYNALHLAVYFNQPEIVEFLLTTTLDINQKTTKSSYDIPEKVTALDIARIKKYKNIQKLLITAGAR